MKMSRKMPSVILVLAMFLSLCVPVAAVASESSSVPEGYVIIDENDPMLIMSNEEATEEDADFDVAPIAQDIVHVRCTQIQVYPMAVNRDTNKKITNPSIKATISYSTSTQAEILRLSNNETLKLMNKMQAHIDSLGGNYELYGWYFKGTMLFESNSPQYITYRPTATGNDSTEEVKENTRGGYHEFEGEFPFPETVDRYTTYYYIGFTGNYYYRSSSGNLLGVRFSTKAGFNSSL